MDKLFYDQLCAKEAKYVKLLEAIKLLKEETSSEVADNNHPDILPPAFQSQQAIIKQSNEFLNLPIDRKVLYALKEIGTGNINATLESWKRLEENLDYEFARSKVKQWLNSLSQRGEIAIIRKGAGKRSGVYQYIDEETASLL